jgi:4-hydroxy-4-methyl-2-oxoglutarate aldolase
MNTESKPSGVAGEHDITHRRVLRLRQLDCCAVSDALDKLKLGGVVTGLPQRSGSGRIAGRVVTLKLDAGAARPGAVKHLGCEAIELSGPDNIIVIEQRSGIEAGCWGGLLSLGAKVRHVAGVIADGPVRDIDEAIDQEFPVFSRSLTSFTARGRIVERGTQVPITVGEVLVQPGDYVVADRSAIIFIAERDIERVLEAAELIIAKESAMAKSIQSGTSIGEVMQGSYEQMLSN